MKNNILLFSILGIILQQILGQTCQPGEVEYGNRCFTQEAFQDCNDHLGELDNSEQNNTSIYSHCEDDVGDDNRTFFHFTVMFNNTYQPDFDCVDIEIFFENVRIDEVENPIDSSDFDVWYYDPATEEITYNVKLDNMEDYGCEHTVDEEPNEDGQKLIQWVCDMTANISMAGVVQLEYNYQIIITINRTATSNLNEEGEVMEINVLKNEVEGYCCKNELGIQTALRFCTDMDCDEELPYPITVNRGQEFVVEHYIVNPEFRDSYTIHGIQVNLGDIQAAEIDSFADGYRYIWKIKSNIAMQDLLVTAYGRIDQVDNSPTLLLRILEQEKDTRVKAQEFITIGSVDASNNKGEKQVVQEKVYEDNYGYLYGAAGGMVFLIGVTLVGAYMYVKKQTQFIEKEGRVKSYMEAAQGSRNSLA